MTYYGMSRSCWDTTANYFKTPN